MTDQWFAAEIRTGRLIAYLPSLDIGQDGYLERIISTATSIDAKLHLVGAPENWQRATKPLGSWIGCFDDADPLKPIQWVGFPNFRNPSAADDTLDLTLVTAEGYFEERFVGDLTYDDGTRRDDMTADLLTRYITSDSGPDLGIALQLDYTEGGGPVIDAEDLVLQNADNATVGARMRALFAKYKGEFTVDWAWVSPTDQSMIVGTVRFGTRIGTPAPVGRQPDVQYQLPGQLVDFQRPEDYTPGKGANKVVAYSTGSGGTVPYADPVYAAPDPDRPTVEYRYQPAPSTSPGGLAGYAQRSIKILAPGARAVKMTATLANVEGRRFGVDWLLGDDIGYRVRATDQQGRPILAFPGGVEGVGRAIGVRIAPYANTITPVLAEAAVYVESS